MCPAGEDIARIEMLVSEKKYKDAWETILMENPFPAVCGRVCFHHCENVCNRGEYDHSVGIHHLERFLGDKALTGQYKLSFETLENDPKIAVIGAGPAGLSAAYFLARLGYSTDIFEAESAAGGVLRWGIPRYRLPEDILQSEIDRILELNVQLTCNKSISKDAFEDIRKKYDAVFIGCGYGRSYPLNIPGDNMAQDGLAFLKKVRQGGVAGMTGRAAVIGGGNTAIDVARTLVRLGARPTIVYRRRKQDMPAFAHEVEMALQEGVQLKELLSPVRMKADGGNLRTTFHKMKVVEAGARDRARVAPDGDKTMELRFQHIFTAIGAEPAEGWFTPASTTTDRMIELSHISFTKDRSPLIFGGDLTNPVKSVTDAIASGKQAAIALDAYFNHGLDAVKERIESCRVGDGNALSMEVYLGGERKSRNRRVVAFKDINTDYFTPSSRQESRIIDPDKRNTHFEPFESTYTAAEAMAEAKRCFNCGICNDCDNCRLFCPEVAVVVKNSRRINLDYCKGCGICVVECPRNAMALEEEKI